jgi:hypothetical protein
MQPLVFPFRKFKSAISKIHAIKLIEIDKLGYIKILLTEQKTLHFENIINMLKIPLH